MRYIYLIIFFMAISVLRSQNINKFFLGNSIDTTNARWISGESGTVIWNFEGDSLELDRTYELTMDFLNGGASYLWDDSGKVRLCSNGSWISNTHGDTISWLLTETRGPNFVSERGFPAVNSCIFLRHPDHDTIAYLLYNNLVFFNRINSSSQLLYAEVALRDAPLKDTLISEGNVIFEMEDVFHNNGQHLPIQHANGKDWWIWRQRRESNLYDVILLDENGFNYSHLVETGIPFTEASDTYAISWDMDQIYMVGGRSDEAMLVQILDVDRCDGSMKMLSNFEVRNPAINSLTSCVSSESGDFLYVTTSDLVYQYDLRVEDIKSSEEVVGQYFSTDTCSTGYRNSTYPNSSFDLPFLGPDGKIYILNFGNCSDYSVIHYPDRKGDLCELDAFAYHPPSRVINCLPNLINYGVGPLPPEACITSNSEDISDEPDFDLYPNPVQEGVLTIVGDLSIITDCRVMSVRGDLFAIRRNTISDGKIDVGDLVSGVYLLELWSKNKRMEVLKFIIP